MTASELHSWLRAAQQQRRTLIMGILNATPDSFSDGGRFDSAQAAIGRAREMVEEGADWIDIGGESTRPGSQPIEPAEQVRRVVPVLEALRNALPVVWSIDTRSAVVARAALDAGANAINDISAGRDDPAMLPLAAERNAPIVLMHMQGTPATMQQAPSYQDVVAEVTQFLRRRADAAVVAGVDRANILLDPGIGFGKTLEHNLALLRHTKPLAADLGLPLVIGTSRKGFIGKITGEPVAAERHFGTAGTVAWAVANGAAVVRVHDVAAMRQVVRMTEAIRGNGQ